MRSSQISFWLFLIISVALIIFATMLFAIQFEHPGSGTPRDFQLFPFRLIFQLLLDSRLGGKLYNYEVEYLVVFEKLFSSKSSPLSKVERLGVGLLNKVYFILQPHP